MKYKYVTDQSGHSAVVITDQFGDIVKIIDCSTGDELRYFTTKLVLGYRIDTTDFRELR